MSDAQYIVQYVTYISQKGYGYFVKIKVLFVPPNPKLLDKATSTCFCWAS